ncbi:hypothetical protein HK104_008503 [Borealophlyctis nickersoniae]|nr:hypothetical protein HK104_008503 [Borealophlyctis nickersoniae]
MSLYTLTKNNPNPAPHEVEDAFDGNLCRCTGYRPIIEGARKCTTKKAIGTCTMQNGLTHNGLTDIEDTHKTCKSKPQIKLDPTTDIPFPAPLLAAYQSATGPTSFMFGDEKSGWYRPTKLDELVTIMDTFPTAKIVHGNTEVGIEVKFKNFNYPVFVNAIDIPELNGAVEKDTGVEFGASMSLTKFRAHLESLCKKYKPSQVRPFTALLDNLRYFAGTQIRNVACIAGNIVTASPISDLNPVFVATGSILTVTSRKGGTRQIRMEDFFLGYRKTALQQSEVVVSLFVPFSRPNEYVKAYKQSKRKDDDIAIVNAALRVLIQEEGGKAVWVTKEARFAYGGMGPTTLVAKSASQYVVGKPWTQETVDEASKLLVQDLPLTLSSPGGQIQYRRLLSLSFLHKFHLYLTHALSIAPVSPREISALSDPPRPLSHGTQEYVEGAKGDVIGESLPHLAALKQATGEAVYVDDMPKVAGECYAGLVVSTVGHAKILSVDPAAALEVKGVRAYISAKDIPNWKPDEDHNRNVIGPVFRDEELFATNVVYHAHQLIGLIIADTQHTATHAAKLVKVAYEPILPLIVTIEDAIANNSLFSFHREIRTGAYAAGDGESKAVSAPHVVQGVARMSAQEHFYLETQCSLVIPKKEDDEIEVFASTQNPTETQHFVAHTLGIPSNRVVCRVKRMGGGFGGKETRSVNLTLALAVAAKKLGVPVRCMLTREEDMAMSGQRHPFLGDYKIGFTDEGRIVFLELDIYANGGFSMDLSHSVLERAMTHADNCYNIPNFKINGRVCKTNIASNTAFRGFGAPQGMMIAEQYIEHIATYLKKPAEEIRAINLYNPGDVTHFKQELTGVDLPNVFRETITSSEFAARKQKVAEFNAQHRYRKRGIAVIPTKFGLSFTARWLNQAGALVHIYTDGSVLVTHGGTEMGQGLHTKMVQVTAHALGVPLSYVHLSETSTDKVPNTSATAASVSSDLNGMAILDACNQINERLKPFREREPKMTWQEIIAAAYMERINLSANGHYRTPDLSWNWDTQTGRMYNYFTYGAACAEVEIDTLTGDHVVLRSDVVMDIGKSLNPAVDIGQIEGAYMQGQGWCTIEEPLVSPTTGWLLTRGPGAYKIPGFRDVPIDLRVRFVKGAQNPRAIHSSKAVGEPPLFMGAAVFFAIKDAVASARKENGVDGYFRLDSPATSERIRVACGGPLTNVAGEVVGEGKPWGAAA